MVDSGQWKLNAGVKLIKEGRNERREARAGLGGHVRHSPVTVKEPEEHNLCRRGTGGGLLGKDA